MEGKKTIALWDAYVEQRCRDTYRHIEYSGGRVVADTIKPAPPAFVWPDFLKVSKSGFAIAMWSAKDGHPARFKIINLKKSLKTG